MELEEDVLVLRRIHVVYRLEAYGAGASAEERQAIERVHGFHARFCPVYRSLTPTIEITTELAPADG